MGRATIFMPDVENGADITVASDGHSGPSDQQVDGQAPATADTEAIAQAVIHHIRGDAAGALNLLLSIDSAERSIDLLFALGFIQIELGQYEAAAQTYNDLVQKQPEAAEAWFQWGFCLYRLGHTAEALQRFEHAAALKSDWIEIPLGRAICHLKLKQHQAALERVDECLALDARHVPALFAKAVTYHVMWEFDQALPLYRRIVDEDPQNTVALMNLITLGLQQKQYDVVRHYSEQLLALHPDVALAVEGIAIAAFHEQDYATASRYFVRLVELAPEQPSNWLNLGVAYDRQGRMNDAVAAFTKTRELRPDSVYAHTYLAGALWKNGDLVSAKACYEHAIVKWPEREDLALSLSQVLDELGDVATAAGVCQEFCQRDAGRTRVWFHLGYLQFKLAKFLDAAQSFERALSLKAAWPEAEINLALAWHMAARYDQAEAVLLRLLEREPDHLEALKGLATVALARGRYEHSQSLHEKLLQLTGPDADAYYNCGLLAQKLHDARRAVDYYRQAVATRPTFAEALLNLGHALTEIGEGGEANSSWISALELRPEFARGYFRKS